MTLGIVLMVLLALAGSAGDTPHKAAPRQASGPASKDALEKTLPAGAKQAGPDLWRYTDAQGRSWVYRRTPFGFVRAGEQESEPADRAEAPAEMRAFEEGDRIRFERATPFGVVRWTRKKTELNDVERAAWRSEQKRQASREHVEQ